MENFLSNFDKYLILFPCLVPELLESGSGLILKLFGLIIPVCGLEYAVEFRWDTWRCHKTSLNVKCDNALSSLIRGHRDEMFALLEASTTFEHFLYDFKQFVDRLCSKCKRANETSVATKKFAGGFRSVLESLNKIDSTRVEFVGMDYRQVNLLASDSRGRTHRLNLTLDDEGVASAKPQLPLKIEPFSDSADLLKRLPVETLHAAFANQLAQFEPFWDEMDAIDEACWVVEPPPPVTDRSATYRRIILTPYTSLQIKVDPMNPRSFPACAVIGPEEERKRFFENINQRVFMWDIEQRLLDNLERILDVLSFPTPKAFEQKIANECQICYSQHLTMPVPNLTGKSSEGDENVVVFPDIVCPGEKCCRLFHKDCLLEWFRSLPNTRQSFKTWTGECPFCSTSISLQMGNDAALW